MYTFYYQTFRIVSLTYWFREFENSCRLQDTIQSRYINCTLTGNQNVPISLLVILRFRFFGFLNRIYLQSLPLSSELEPPHKKVFTIVLHKGKDFSNIHKDFEALFKSFSLPSWLNLDYDTRITTIKTYSLHTHSFLPSSPFSASSTVVQQQPKPLEKADTTKATGEIPCYYVTAKKSQQDRSNRINIYFYQYSKDPTSSSIQYYIQTEETPLLYQNEILVNISKLPNGQQMTIDILDSNQIFKHLFSECNKQKFQRTGVMPLKHNQFEYCYIEPEDHRCNEENQEQHFHLAFQGGGAKGVAYIGGFNALKDLYKRCKIKSVIGSSAGAIISLAISAGASSEQLIAICKSLDKMPLDKSVKSLQEITPQMKAFYDQVKQNIRRIFHDYGILNNTLFDLICNQMIDDELIDKFLEFLCGQNDSLKEMFSLEVDHVIEEKGCFGKVKSRRVEKRKKYVNYYGFLQSRLMTGNAIKNISLGILKKFMEQKYFENSQLFEKVLQVKVLSKQEFFKSEHFDAIAESLNMRQFYELTYSIQFTCTAVDLESQILRFFNHKTTPDLPVCKAVQISGSFPVAFESLKWKPEWGRYCIHYKNTRKEIDLTNHQFSDGGILANFPIKYLDNEQMRPMYFSHKSNKLTRIFGFGVEYLPQEKSKEKEMQVTKLKNELVDIIKKKLPKLKFACYQYLYTPKPEMVPFSEMLPLTQIPLLCFLQKIMKTYKNANDNLVRQCFAKTIYFLPEVYSMEKYLVYQPPKEQVYNRYIGLNHVLSDLYTATASVDYSCVTFLEKLEAYRQKLVGYFFDSEFIMQCKAFLRSHLIDYCLYRIDDQKVQNKRMTMYVSQKDFSKELKIIDDSIHSLLQDLTKVNRFSFFESSVSMDEDAANMQKIIEKTKEIFQPTMNTSSSSNISNNDRRTRHFNRFFDYLKNRDLNNLHYLIKCIERKVHAIKLTEVQKQKEENRKVNTTTNKVANKRKKIERTILNTQNHTQRLANATQLRISDTTARGRAQSQDYEETLPQRHDPINESQITEGLAKFSSQFPHKSLPQFKEFQAIIQKLEDFTLLQQLEIEKQHEGIYSYIDNTLQKRKNNNIHLVFQGRGVTGKYYLEIYKIINEYVFMLDKKERAYLQEKYASKILDSHHFNSVAEYQKHKSELIYYLEQYGSKNELPEVIEFQDAKYKLALEIRLELQHELQLKLADRPRVTSITCTSIHAYLGFLIAAGCSSEMIEDELRNLHLFFQIDYEQFQREFNKKQWLVPEKCMVREFQDMLWKRRYDLFSELEKGLRNKTILNRLDKVKEEFQNSKEVIMDSFNSILQYVISNELKANNMKSFEQFFAQELSLNYKGVDYRKVNQKISEDTKEVLSSFFAHFYEQIRYFVLHHSEDNIMNYLKHAADADQREAIWRGIIMAKLLKTDKFKYHIQDLLKRMNLPKDMKLKEFYQLSPKKIELSFGAVDMSAHSIVFINHHTYPEMPIWAALTICTSSSSLFPPIRSRPSWLQKIDQNALDRYIKTFFSYEESYRLAPMFVSANLLASFPLELLTNEKIRSVYFAGQNYTFLNFGLAPHSYKVDNDIDAPASMKYFRRKFLTLGDTVRLGIKGVLGMTQMVEFSALSMIQGEKMNAYQLSHDNMILQLYYKQLLRLPIRIATLEFDKLKKNEPGTTVQNILDQTYYYTREKFYKEKVTYIEITLENKNLNFRFLSKERNNKDFNRKYRIEYRTPNDPYTLVANDLVTLLKEQRSIYFKFFFVSDNQLDRKTGRYIQEMEFELQLVDLYKMFQSFSVLYEFPYSKIINGKLFPVRPLKRVSKNESKECEDNNSNVIVCKSIVNIEKNGLYCELCCKPLVARGGYAAPNFGNMSSGFAEIFFQEACIKCDKKIGIKFLCSNEEQLCPAKYCLKCTKSHCVVRTSENFVCNLGHEYMFVSEKDSIKSIQKNKSYAKCDLCSGYTESYYVDNKCDLKICQFCSAQFAIVAL